MNTDNKTTNEQKTAQDIVKSMDNESNVAMEKNMKLAFIFSIIALVAAIVGVSYSAILIICVVIFCVNAIKVEEYKSKAIRSLAISGAALLITIIRLIFA